MSDPTQVITIEVQGPTGPAGAVDPEVLDALVDNAPPSRDTLGKLSAAIDATPDAGFAVAGATSARSSRVRWGDTITPMDFGAVGDRIADDTIPLNLCRDQAVQQGKIVDYRGRFYRVTSNVLLPYRPRDIRLDISAVVTSQGVTGTSDRYGAMIAGADMWAAGYPVATLLTAAAKWDITVAVDSVTASQIVPGDRVLVWQNTNWISAYTPPKKSEFNIVESTDLTANTITFVSPLKQPYGTTATVRRYGVEEADISNLEIYGGGEGLNQGGLLLANLRLAKWDSVRMMRCHKRCLVLNNVFSFEGDSVEGDESSLQGFGYALSVSGAGNGYVGSVVGRHCRHAVTHGPSGGFGVITRDVGYGSVRGIGGTDAAFDSHAGAKNISVGSISARGNLGAAYPVSDAVIYQGAGRFTVSNIDVSGFARNGVFLQPEGDGDGDAADFVFGSISAQGDPTISQYGIVYSDSAAAVGEAPCNGLHVGYVDISSRLGSFVSATTNQLRQVTFGSGRIEGTGAGALRLQSSGSGSISEFDAGCVHYKAPATIGTNVLYVQGASGSSIRKARTDRATIDGGQYSLRADYGTVIRPQGSEMFGYLTGTFVSGTAGYSSAVPIRTDVAWSPDRMGSALLAWLDAWDATTITQSSNAVSAWNSKVNNYSYASSNAAELPTYNATGWDGINPCVTFNGLQSGNILTAAGPFAANLWVFMVARRGVQADGSNTLNRALFSTALSSGGASVLAVVLRPGSDAGQTIFRASGLGTGAVASNATPFGSGSKAVLFASYSAANIRARLNGGAQGSQGAVGASTQAVSTLGGGPSSVDSRFAGDIAALIVVDPSLLPNGGSDAERQVVEAYLYWRYGAGSLDAGNTYQAFRP